MTIPDIPSGDLQVVARVVQLLRLLGEAGTIDLVSAAAGAGRGKVHGAPLPGLDGEPRLLQRRDRNRYEFGPLLAELGTMALSRLGVVNVARPVMEQISLRVRHTVVLTIWNGRQAVVAQVHEDSSRTAHVSIRSGSVLRAGTAQDCVFRAFRTSPSTASAKKRRMTGRRLTGWQRYAGPASPSDRAPARECARWRCPSGTRPIASWPRSR